MTQIQRLDYAKADIRMYVSNDREATYRLHACAKEPWTVAWIEQMPAGSVLYDVGACVGSYSLVAASLGHQVVAIEPSFANYARLCENILLNDFGPRVIPFCMALSDMGGRVELLEQELQPGYSGGAKRLRVPVLPLLDLFLLFGAPHPTHIKVDVDGGEAAIVAGVQDLLPDVSWLIEVQTGHERAVEQLLGDPVQIFDQRNGQKIHGMSMRLYEPKRTLAVAQTY